MGNCYLIVIDGLGVGAQEDAHLYGDEEMNTLGHVSAQTKCHLPTLGKLGIGNIIPLQSVPPTENPSAAYGKMREVSAGKDSTTGHWEIAGIQLDKPFPTYEDGFPEEIVNTFLEETGLQEILCNAPYSGTDVIRDYGDEHVKRRAPIVYTSADSVFQIACHVDVVPIEQQYEWCKIARNKVMIDDHAVGRVIARPFKGVSGAYERITDLRHDFSLIPPPHNINQVLSENGIRTYSIGKIIDLFAEQGFSDYERTKNNGAGLAQLLKIMKEVEDTFVFVNLIDTDQLYGHRLDPEGFAHSLKQFDDTLPAILANLKEDDILIITADHGNDPCSTSTDHSREFVPLLVYPASKTNTLNLGTRNTFSDIACSVASYFGISHNFPGLSFIE